MRRCRFCPEQHPDFIIFPSCCCRCWRCRCCCYRCCTPSVSWWRSATTKVSYAQISWVDICIPWHWGKISFSKGSMKFRLAHSSQLATEFKRTQSLCGSRSLLNMSYAPGLVSILPFGTKFCLQNLNGNSLKAFFSWPPSCTTHVDFSDAIAPSLHVRTRGLIMTMKNTQGRQLTGIRLYNAFGNNKSQCQGGAGNKSALGVVVAHNGIINRFLRCCWVKAMFYSAGRAIHVRLH